MHASYSTQFISLFKTGYKHLFAMLLGLSSLGLGLTGTYANAQAENPNLATDVSNYYIPSFYTKAQDQRENLMNRLSQDRAAHDLPSVNLDKATQLRLTFNAILAKSNQLAFRYTNMEPILNEYAWKDLKLFYGTTSDPNYHLMSRINRTITSLGEAALATLLVVPTSDIITIQQRQEKIKTLLAHPQEAAYIKNKLAIYKQSEESMLSFWSETDPLYTKEYNDYMDSKFYAKGNTGSNKSAGWLELKKRFFRDFFSIQFRFLYPLTQPLIGETFFRETLLNSPEERKLMWMGPIPYYGGWYRWDILKKNYAAFGKKPANWNLVPIVLSEVVYTWSAYTGISNYLEYASVLRNLALRMADIQVFLHTAQQMSDTIAATPMLEQAYGDQLTAVRALLAQAKNNTELGKLVVYLQKLPLHNWSYFFNNAGKLLASHKLFIEHKEAFSDAIYEMGLLDAYLSFATLIQESQNYHQEHSYVFAQFLDRKQKSKPYIKIEDMWNPFLDAKQAVGNNIEMDAKPGGVRNIILTGPNAGGKSTFLTGVTNTLLLAHVVGIAPAKSITLTPFNRINTYIDVGDDIAAGKSLFMAEVDRSQKHIKLLQNLKEDEFSFTIFDEPFSGTNPTEGAAAEYSILESIAEYTNSLSLVATHYPIVMLLEQRAKGKGFANFKVYITRGQDKKLHYTYKILPGRSTQAIAIDILEEQGYDLKMLERAREIIEHPEKYQANF